MINASGTYDAIAARRVFGEQLLEEFPFSAFVSKTITPEPRAGNPPQRIWETPAGMINSIGLPNKGLEGFLAEDLPQLAELPVPLIVSVMATGREEFARLVEAVGARDEVAAIELNVSCPNVHSGLIVGEQPTETGAAGSAAATDREAADREADPERRRPRGGRVAAEEGGADAVSLINTLKASAIDPAPASPGSRPVTAASPGPAVRPVACSSCARSGRRRAPARSAWEGSPAAPTRRIHRRRGALVAVGTESFRDPRAGARVAAELAEAGASGALRRSAGAQTSSRG